MYSVRIPGELIFKDSFTVVIQRAKAIFKNNDIYRL